MKYTPRVWPSTEVNTKRHHAVGMVWRIMSSKKDKSYSVTMVDSGFTCDCPAFKRCKHIDEVEAKFCC